MMRPRTVVVCNEGNRWSLPGVTQRSAVADEVDDVGEAPDGTGGAPTAFVDLMELDPDAECVLGSVRLARGAQNQFGDLGDETGPAHVVERTLWRGHRNSKVRLA